VETLIHVLNGFSIALEPINIFYTFIGVLMGTVVGVLPGIGPSAGIALLIPVTFGIEPTSALIMLAGIYYGAMYGGSTSAILINTPGEAASVMTAIDGFKMAKKGRAGAALAASAWGSFIAGTIGIVGLTLLAIPLANIALKFGPAEYCMLMLFAMTAVSSLAGKSPGKAMVSTVAGLMTATVGVDLQSGQSRYTMDIIELEDGVGFLIVVVGLFAISEVLVTMEQMFKGHNEITRIKGKLMLTVEEWRRALAPMFRGGLIGFFIGVLPGAGSTVATILSYVTEKRLSKHPEEFGEGAIEGVAGPEAANNASTTGAMVPLLTLGIPGSGTTSVLLGAFMLYGIQPGPLLFESRPDLVWGVIDSMYLGNLMLLILNLPLVGLFVRLLYIPSGILMPLVMALATIGVYAINNNPFELFVALAFGVLGYLFRKIDIPLAPFVLAVVLGAPMEQSFRQALQISDGSPAIFVNSEIGVILVLLTTISIAVPVLFPVIRRLKAGPEDLDS
jgi:putative tricarboxylic transport membrane protein